MAILAIKLAIRHLVIFERVTSTALPGGWVDTTNIDTLFGDNALYIGIDLQANFFK